MPSAEYTHALFGEFETRLAVRHARMRDASDVYYGRKELPLPELGKSEKAAVPNLLRLGADGLGQRIASVLPNIDWPSLRPGIDTRDNLADQRRRANYGWWEINNYRRITARRGRWLITYASAPVIIRPDRNILAGGGPRWETHSPFDVFPGPMHTDSCTPDEVIIRHTRTLRWLQERYPDAMARVRKGNDPKPTDEFTCLEHITPDEICMVVLGRETQYSYQSNQGSLPEVELYAPYPNLAGMCWAVIPEQTCLDAPAGKFDDIIGMYETQAAMMALQIIAARDAIMPEVWAENPNGPAIPNIIQSPDRRAGQMGIITNGVLQRSQLDPGFRGQDVIDRLEYAQRQTAGLPAEMGGSGSQNVRTGRRGSQIMAAAIDFTIAEAQDALAESAREENHRAAAIDKAYFNTKKTMYVSWKGARGKVEYTPGDIFETDAHCIARYPIAGTDLSDLVINGGQRVGMGTMSKRSFMDIDPLVDDPEGEQQRVNYEGVYQAFFASLQNLVANPEGPLQPHHVADLLERIDQGEEPHKAYLAIHTEIQEAQAQGAPMGSPETMSGLGTPGQGSEIPPSIPGLGPGTEDMTGLLSQLGVADMALGAR